MKRTIGLIFIFVLLPLTILFGASFNSYQSGSWFSPSTWGGITIPGINDDVTIRSGHIIQLDGASQISIRSLVITGGAGGQGVLLGANSMLTTLIVRNNVHLTENTIYANGSILRAGTDGILDVQVGDNLQVSNSCEYYARRTTFTALGEGNTQNICPLYQGITASMNSIFDTANPDIIIQVQSALNLNGSIWGSFENSKIHLWSTVGFTNCAFRNCELTPTSSTGHNTFSNCHFTATTAVQTVYFTGPVAVLDNSSMFNNVTIEGGSLWGNINAASQTSITGNLTLTTGTISWGDGGTLDLFIGGNMNLGGWWECEYKVTNTYLNGNRPENNPQTIFTNLGFEGNLVNQWSYLRLDSGIWFEEAPTKYTFNVGYANILDNEIRNAQLTGGYITCYYNYGEIIGCEISSIVFNNMPELTYCTINDNNVVFNEGLTIRMALYSAEGQNIQTTINGIMYVRGIVQAKQWGSFSIILNGDCYLMDTLRVSNLTFTGTGTKYLHIQSDNPIFSNITNNGETLVINPYIDPYEQTLPIYLNGAQLLGDWSNDNNRFVLSRSVMISNGFFAYCRMANAETPHAGVTLNNIAMLDCDFYLPVEVMGTCVLDDNQTEFHNTLNVLTLLTGAFGMPISVKTQNLTMGNGIISPGEYGTMSLNIYGNYVSLVNAQMNATEINFRYAGETRIFSENAINSTINVSSGSNLAFINNISFNNKTITMESGCEINLENHIMSNVTLNNGYVHDGVIGNSGAFHTSFRNIQISDDFLLGTTDIVFNGNTYNSGTIRGSMGANSVLKVMNNFQNLGNVLAGTGGTIESYTYGDVLFSESGINSWNGVIHLRGNTARHLEINMASANIVVDGDETDGNANFSLTGMCRMPSFTIADNCSVTVPSLTNLTFVHPGQYYTGNLILNGVLQNSRNPIPESLIYHQLNLTLNGDYSEAGFLEGYHAMYDPGSLANNTGEYWEMYSETVIPDMTATMNFYYQGEYNSKNALFYSTDNKVTWHKFAGTSYQNPETRMLTALYAPLNAFYAISPVVDTWRETALISPDTTNTVLMPTFTWNAFPGATAYSLVIANDPDMLDIIYQTPDSSATSHHALIPLAPNSVFYWRVNCVSSLGTFTSVQASFSTRQALGCSLPEAVVILPDNYSSFYMPVFLSGILSEESYNVIPTPSAHIFGDFVDGQLTMTPDPGWFGVETVNLEIYDCYTTINTSIEITVLGTPHDINIACVGNETFLDWPNIPGSTYCKVYYCETTDGTWNYLGWTSSNSYVHPQTGVKGFYRITACTGGLPEQTSIK